MDGITLHTWRSIGINTRSVPLQEICCHHYLIYLGQASFIMYFLTALLTLMVILSIDGINLHSVSSGQSSLVNLYYN